MLSLLAIIFLLGCWDRHQNTKYMRKLHEETMAKKAEQDAQWQAMSYADKKKMMAVGSAMFNGPFEDKEHV